MDDDRTRDLDALGARLAEAELKHRPREVARSALAGGTRYAVEIAIATGVGGFIGWQLDRWFGTAPWLLLLFLMLGIAAGFLNLMRAVNREAAKVTAEQKAAAARGAAEADARDEAARGEKED